MPVLPSTNSRPQITAESVSRFAELVKKIETSPASATKKRTIAARKKLTRAIKEQWRCAAHSGLRAIALTLTYQDSSSFESKHISAFLDKVRRFLKCQGHSLPYAWVLECSGQLHYHLILWLPRTCRLAFSRLETWWPWGSTWIAACQCVKGWARYITKLDSASKIPAGARLYGYGGLDTQGRAAVSHAGLPCWLLAHLKPGEMAHRIPGGYWVNIKTGEVYRSPYVWTPWGQKLRSA